MLLSLSSAAAVAQHAQHGSEVQLKARCHTELDMLDLHCSAAQRQQLHHSAVTDSMLCVSHGSSCMQVVAVGA